MPFLGTLVNFLVVLTCGLAGLLIKKGVPNRMAESIKSAMGICVIYIAINSAVEVAPTVNLGFVSDGLVKVLVMVVSMAFGTLIGELVDIDKWVNRLGDFLESKLVKGGEKGKFAEGFVHCSLLFCVGAMTITGAFEDANGNPDILIAKSVIDGVMCLIIAPTLGIGCAASSVFVLVYQGLLTAMGVFISDIILPESIAYTSATGALVVMLIGTNMLGMTKVKTANMVPAIFLPALIWPIISTIIS